MVFPATIELWAFHCPPKGAGILGTIFSPNDCRGRARASIQGGRIRGHSSTLLPYLGPDISRKELLSNIPHLLEPPHSRIEISAILILRGLTLQ